VATTTNHDREGRHRPGNWVIGAVGALAALAGSIVGATASILIADAGFEHQEADRLFNAKRASYSEFLGTVQEANAHASRLYFLMEDAADEKPQSKALVGLEQKYDREREALAEAIGPIHQQVADVNLYANEPVLTSAAYLADREVRVMLAVPEDMLDETAREAFVDVTSELNSRIATYIRAVREDLHIPAVEFDQADLPEPLPY
jgi:hypothetical protein